MLPAPVVHTADIDARVIRPVGFLIASALVAGPASVAGATPCALTVAVETVAVERVVDGDTVRLDDGREVRLAGIAAPKAPLGKKPQDWPLDAVSRTALEQAAAGQVMELRPAGAGRDRYGRVVGFLARVEAADHAGIAVDLLSRGVARLSADGLTRDCGATLREAEDGAIGARLGLWSEPYYEVRDAADGAALASVAGRYVVAEGRVVSVRTAAGRAYVNFGSRWRDALSLSLSEASLRKLGGFARLGIEAGARLRVRGIVDARPGPSMRLADAAQVERLDAPGGAR